MRSVCVCVSMVRRGQHAIFLCHHDQENQRVLPPRLDWWVLMPLNIEVASCRRVRKAPRSRQLAVTKMLVLEIAGYDPDSDVGESYVGVEPTKMHQITMLLEGLVAIQTQHRVFEVAIPRRASCRSSSMKRRRRRSTTRQATAPVCRPPRFA